MQRSTMFAAGLLAVIAAIPPAQADAVDETATESAVDVGDLIISGFWTRATLPGQKVGGGYMSIENTGSENDRLISLASPATDRVEVHEMSVENDIMTMRKVDGGLDIPAGERVTLAPGGYHLMFQDLREGFVEGESIELTLGFDKAGAVTLDLPVRPAGSRDAGGHDHH